MDASTRAPRYDLFKLIVAVLLLILAVIFMLLSAPQTAAVTATPFLLTPTVAPASLTSPPLTATTSFSASPTATHTSGPGAAPSPSSTSVPATITPSPSALPTGTEAAGLSPTPSPLPAATEVSQPSPTPLPAPTAASPVAATPTPAASAENICQAVTSRSQLQVGMDATVLHPLNFRSSPGIRGNWVLTNIPGTRLTVIGGPECLPYWTGAYLWWQVRLPDGRVGWSAEGSLHGSFYFLEPAK